MLYYNPSLQAPVITSEAVRMHRAQTVLKLSEVASVISSLYIAMNHLETQLKG